MSDTSIKKYFISFANEKFSGALERIVKQVTLLNCFDVIRGYTDKDLENCADFWEKHGEFVKNNPRGHGYWIWKSYLTLKTLREMNEGDILVYADAGCEVNYDGLHQLEHFFEKVKKDGFLSFQLNDLMYHHEERWTKMDLFKHFRVEHFRPSLQLHSTYFVLQKGENALKITNMWYDTVSNYHLIDDTPSIAPNDMYFYEHRHDQSVFSIVRKLHKHVFIYTPLNLVEARYPFFDKRNPRKQSVFYTKKTVIDVWTHNVCNLTTDTVNNFWGLGDIIRGTIRLYQLCKKMGYDFIVDIQHHPISKYLKCTNLKYHDLVKYNKDRIEFIMGDDLESHVSSNDNDVILMLTNAHCDEDAIDDECKEFIRTLFTPTDFFKEYIDIKMSEIPAFDSYNILHYRLGDDELVRKNANSSSIDMVEHILTHIQPNDILICDSMKLKEAVLKKININSFDIKSVHLGYEKNPSRILETLFEFFMIMKSSKIRTYSTYGWTSGFVYWPHKIYDIPLERI